MQNNRIVNDTVYGHIAYSGVEEKFLQSKIVNRLMFVSQNALAYFAFPSITTKRYIHSMGTMNVASYMFKYSLINTSSKNRSKFLKKALKIYTNLPEEEFLKSQRKVLNIYNYLSIICNEQGKFQETREAYIGALIIYKRLISDNSDDYKSEFSTLLYDFGSLYLKNNHQNKT